MLLVDWSIGWRLYHVVLTGLLGTVITTTRDTHLATMKRIGMDMAIFPLLTQDGLEQGVAMRVGCCSEV